MWFDTRTASPPKWSSCGPESFVTTSRMREVAAVEIAFVISADAESAGDAEDRARAAPSAPILRAEAMLHPGIAEAERRARQRPAALAVQPERAVQKEESDEVVYVWLTDTFCTRTAFPALRPRGHCSVGSPPDGRNR